MTEDEMMAVKAGVIDELRDLRCRRACLKTKAEKFQGQIKSADKVLENALASRFTSDSEPSKDGWPSYDDLVSVFKGLEATDQRIGDLEGRLREWGAIE